MNSTFAMDQRYLHVGCSLHVEDSRHDYAISNYRGLLWVQICASHLPAHRFHHQYRYHG